MKKPHGIIEVLLIKIDKLYFLVDFLVLDMEPGPSQRKQILVILGLPFLAKVNACINSRTRVIDLSFGNMKARLNIFNASNQPSIEDECFMIDFHDELVKEDAPFLLEDDSLQTSISCEGCEEIFDVDKSITKI